MQLDIAAHIEKLLFLHDALTIPSFGAFTAQPAAAAADYIGGTVTPPSKILTFNENVKADDGLLIQDLAKTNGIATEDARQAVQSFVDQMQAQLNQREIVTLPGIGRLYKNYVQKIQFLPDATNFNAESYGLPPLQFSPIARSREVVEKPQESAPMAAPVASTAFTQASPAVGTPAPLNEAPPPFEARKSSANVLPSILIGATLLMLLLVGGLWYWQNQKKASKIVQAEPQEKAVVPSKDEEDETSVRPTEKTAQSLRQQPATSPADEDLEQAAKESVSKKMQAARQEAKSGGGRDCILVIATLREKTNADRLTRMLKEEGYQLYSIQKNGYQIGIQFRYTQLNEIQEKMLALQRLTGEKDIWIKKR